MEEANHQESRLSKADRIREYIKSNPRKLPKAIAEALSNDKEKIDVSYVRKYITVHSGLGVVFDFPNA